ncbi:MAG: aspartate aminotransferase family protein [Parcubacteria group bacterium]|nr:aspartate aminotransferase family protein [Parcubacteria group bacterium]
MSHVVITGLPNDISINGIRCNELGVSGHQQIIRTNAPKNYLPFDGWICIGRGKTPWTLRVTQSGKDEAREVIDCQSMYGSANLGHGNEAVLEPFLEYLGKTYAAHSRVIDSDVHAPALLALRLYTGMDGRILFKTGGAEIVDTLIKVARRFLAETEAKRRRSIHSPVVIYAKNAFHGRTISATSFLDGESQRGFGPFIRAVGVPFGDASALECTLRENKGSVACVLLEPIQGEGGIIIPPPDYLLRAQELCREYGTLFALDEIQTGFGRTGKDFAYQHCAGVEPDLMVIAKALGGGIIPASALVGKKEILQCLNPGDEGSTWSASPLICMGVLAAIKEVCDKDLAHEARVKGERFIAKLRTLQSKFPEFVKDVRGKGLMIALEFKKDAVWTRDFSHRLLSNGVMASPTRGTIIRILPPLCITTEALRQIARVFEETLQAS